MTRPWLVAVVIAIVVATSIAAVVFSAAPPRANSPRHGQDTVDTFPVDPSGASSSVDFVISTNDAGAPLARQLDVFSARRAGARRIPVGVFGDIARAVGPTFDLPDSFVGRARLLLAHLGQDEQRFYAVPDTNGDVCYALVPSGEPNCARGLVHGIDAHVDPGSAGRRGDVYGLVSNRIVSARVQVGTRWHGARLAHNAMFYELPAKVELPRRFELRERTGVIHSFKIYRER
jgi:hypothetical protein